MNLIYALCAAIAGLAKVLWLILRRLWGKNHLLKLESQIEEKLKAEQSKRKNALLSRNLADFYASDAECRRLSEELRSIRTRLKNYQAG